MARPRRCRRPHIARRRPAGVPPLPDDVHGLLPGRHQRVVVRVVAPLRLPPVPVHQGRRVTARPAVVVHLRRRRHVLPPPRLHLHPRRLVPALELLRVVLVRVVRRPPPQPVEGLGVLVVVDAVPVDVLPVGRAVRLDARPLEHPPQPVVVDRVRVRLTVVPVLGEAVLPRPHTAALLPLRRVREPVPGRAGHVVRSGRLPLVLLHVHRPATARPRHLPELGGQVVGVVRQLPRLPLRPVLEDLHLVFHVQLVPAQQLVRVLVVPPVEPAVLALVVVEVVALLAPRAVPPLRVVLAHVVVARPRQTALPRLRRVLVEPARHLAPLLRVGPRLFRELRPRVVRHPPPEVLVHEVVEVRDQAGGHPTGLRAVLAHRLAVLGVQVSEIRGVHQVPVLVLVDRVLPRRHRVHVVPARAHDPRVRPVPRPRRAARVVPPADRVLLVVPRLHLQVGRVPVRAQPAHVREPPLEGPVPPRARAVPVADRLRPHPQVAALHDHRVVGAVVALHRRVDAALTDVVDRHLPLTAQPQSLLPHVRPRRRPQPLVVLHQRHVLPHARVLVDLREVRVPDPLDLTHRVVPEPLHRVAEVVSRRHRPHVLVRKPCVRVHARLLA